MSISPTHTHRFTSVVVISDFIVCPFCVGVCVSINAVYGLCLAEKKKHFFVKLINEIVKIYKYF